MIALSRTLVGLVVGWWASRLVALLARLHVASAPTSRRTTRRGFVRNATLGAVGVVLAEMGILFVRLIWPNKTGVFGSVVTLAKADVPPVNGPPFTNVPGKFYLIHTEDGLLALYWKCPHLGCTVPWKAGENRFHCPCHGSIYLYNGVRIAGPAPRPMDLMKVNALGSGDIEVDTGTITTRSEYTKEQAVPYPA